MIISKDVLQAAFSSMRHGEVLEETLGSRGSHLECHGSLCCFLPVVGRSGVKKEGQWQRGGLFAALATTAVAS